MGHSVGAILGFATLAVGMVTLTGVWIVAKAIDEPFAIFTKDPASLVGRPLYYGVLAQVGIVMWCLTAGALGVAASATPSTPDRRRRYYTWAALFTLTLALDDLFLVHEEIYTALIPGPGEALLFAYGLLLLGGLITYKDIVLHHSSPGLLAAALGFLVASLIIDVASELTTAELTGAEDGAKLLGMLLWAAYFSRTAYEGVRAVDQRSAV